MAGFFIKATRVVLSGVSMLLECHSFICVSVCLCAGLTSMATVDSEVSSYYKNGSIIISS